MKMNGETTLSTIPKPARAPKTGHKSNGSPVDWEAIRRKVLDSSARLVWMDEVNQDVLEQTWARRAIQMAQGIEDGESGEQIQIAVIRLGREIYGLDTDYIHDIRQLDNITRVPRVPGWVAGVVNLRGRIISVLDLHHFLGLPPIENKSESESSPRHLVVVGTPTMELALLVDGVLAIESLPTNQIQEATSAVRSIQAEYMRGIVSRTQAGSSQILAGGNGYGEAESSDTNDSKIDSFHRVDTSLLLILDLPALLSDKRLIMHEDII
ncbi:MAG: hypothetical protein A2029_08415 [Chloroflexi bacterium RBG_19FT_COMBO_47_9]|nr:MAG: hypothetical protein A2029_08415 [Chloroflexi bacterium RBG_19FT_COMBO_47_9]